MGINPFFDGSVAAAGPFGLPVMQPCNSVCADYSPLCSNEPCLRALSSKAMNPTNAAAK
jgi:hypothetical protein